MQTLGPHPGPAEWTSALCSDSQEVHECIKDTRLWTHSCYRPWWWRLSLLSWGWKQGAEEPLRQRAGHAVDASPTLAHRGSVRLTLPLSGSQWRVISQECLAESTARLKKFQFPSPKAKEGVTFRHLTLQGWGYFQEAEGGVLYPQGGGRVQASLVGSSDQLGARGEVGRCLLCLEVCLDIGRFLKAGRAWEES